MCVHYRSQLEVEEHIPFAHESRRYGRGSLKSCVPRCIVTAYVKFSLIIHTMQGKPFVINMILRYFSCGSHLLLHTHACIVLKIDVIHWSWWCLFRYNVELINQYQKADGMGVGGRVGGGLLPRRSTDWPIDCLTDRLSVRPLVVLSVRPRGFNVFHINYQYFMRYAQKKKHFDANADCVVVKFYIGRENTPNTPFS